MPLPLGAPEQARLTPLGPELLAAALALLADDPVAVEAAEAVALVARARELEPPGKRWRVGGEQPSDALPACSFVRVCPRRGSAKKYFSVQTPEPCIARALARPRTAS